jgi:hypothetical protein
MRPEIQVRMQNVVSKPASETWVLTSQDQKRTATAQIRFLRSMSRIKLGGKKGGKKV